MKINSFENSRIENFQNYGVATKYIGEDLPPFMKVMHSPS